MQLLFWLCLFLVGYTYLGYPVWLKVLFVLGRKKRGGSEIGAPPSLSIVLVVYKEVDRVEARLRNLAACDYGGEREIIVVCDGGDEASAEAAKSTEIAMPVRVIVQEERKGKAGGLNRGVEAATGDIIIFADARQEFDSQALNKLVEPFRQNSEVVAVSGNLEIAATAEGAGAGIDAYWKLERWIRFLESELDSVIGCTGAIYALRKESFHPIPVDTILDDVVIPMQALMDGGRVLFEPEALAFDPQQLAPEKEMRRKIRTLAGNYQMFFRYPQWLNPLKNRCWWRLISHKYLRLAGPLFLLLSLISAGVLAAGSGFYRAAFIAQLVCYGLGGLGLVFKKVRSPLLTVPAGFMFLQWQSVRALGYYFRMRRQSESGAWS